MSQIQKKVKSCILPLTLIELDFSMGPEAKRRRQVGSKILTPFPQISSAQDTIDTSTVTKVPKKNYARKAKLGKRRQDEEAGKPLDYNTLIDEIRVACSICMEGAPIDPLPSWEQGKFDKVMSKHMWLRHKVI